MFESVRDPTSNRMIIGLDFYSGLQRVEYSMKKHYSYPSSFFSRFVLSLPSLQRLFFKFLFDSIFRLLYGLRFLYRSIAHQIMA